MDRIKVLTLDSLLEKHSLLQIRVDLIEKRVNKLRSSHATTLLHVEAVCRQAHSDIRCGQSSAAQAALFELLNWLETAR